MPKNEAHKRGRRQYEAGELQLALESFEQAAHDYREVGQPAMVGEMFNNIGVVQRGLKNWEAAIAAVDAALEEFRGLQDRHREAQALGNLGAILLEKDELQAAGEALSQAVEIYNELDEREERAYVLNLLGQVRIKQGRHYDGLLDLDAGLSDLTELSPQQRWLRRLLRLPARLLRGM